MANIQQLTFEQALHLTTAGNKKAVITVGVIQNGQATYKVYGENGVELESMQHTYEIGSITKTFTAALVCKAANESNLSLCSPVDAYLPLPPPGNNSEYPSIRELLAHTSGYKSFYYEKPMLHNFFTGRNSFYGITRDMVVDKAAKKIPAKENSRGIFCYSNFGFALLGLVLEAVYREDYTALVNRFVHDELRLKETRISIQDGDLGRYWKWNTNDAYLSAGALTSTIGNMLSYAGMLLDRHDTVKNCLKDLRTINPSRSQKRHKAIGINMDKIAMSWIFDEKNNVFWHNGGTGSYNSYMAFNLERRTAVVVLSNCPPMYRIPATILGIKRLGET